MDKKLLHAKSLFVYLHSYLTLISTSLKVANIERKIAILKSDCYCFLIPCHPFILSENYMYTKWENTHDKIIMVASTIKNSLIVCFFTRIVQRSKYRHHYLLVLLALWCLIARRTYYMPQWVYINITSIQPYKSLLAMFSIQVGRL